MSTLPAVGSLSAGVGVGGGVDVGEAVVLDVLVGVVSVVSVEVGAAVEVDVLLAVAGWVGDGLTEGNWVWLGDGIGVELGAGVMLGVAV
ncbi:MAG: hypothetical protein ACLFWD_05855 [Anaerolineales bacterium]